MSTTIDQRVVEMRFDNQQFERNAHTSLSTLAKLKQSLNLTGAAKGLENVSASVKKVDMNGLGSAIDTVHARFSALEVMGVTALANITNSAVNAGKKMVSALTIDPLKSGFSEYETKINAIQTIMSNTASKGTTMADVTRVIDELNTYADKTIYNFAEMTRNIGTFTAAGVGLEESASAIQGIANLAAASGSNSQQASTAMYQLSQALAAGTVKLMDWNSVVNAGMGGEKFQEALKATARDHGIAVDDIIKKNGSFRESLQEGWISADILNETLNKFTVDGAKKYAKSMMDSGKWTKEQADALIKEAQSMEDAATKVKTFTQLLDTLKESLQSGWSKTWELIFGDFYEARDLFTGLSNFFGGFIEKTSEFRNNLIEGAMGSPFGKLAEKIEKVTGATEKMKNATKDYGDIVNKVIGGEFGNGQARWDKLTKAGYDWAKVQNLVNKELGSSVRHTEKAAESQEKMNKSQTTTIEQLVKMSDAQLKQLGFTKDEIEAFRDLEEQSKKTGIPIKDLIKDMDQLSGRSLLLNSFKNVGKSLVTIFTAIKEAWVEMFPPMTSKQLYDIIAGMHKFSTYLVVGKDTADELKRTLRGLFAIIDIIATVTGGALKIAIKLICKLLGAADVDILSFTANLGDMIVKFHDWLFENSLIAKGLDKLSEGIGIAITAVKRWIKAFIELPAVQKAIERIKTGFSEMVEVGKNIIEGLQNGLESGIQKLFETVIEIGKNIIEKIKGILGIHSPSTVMFEIGKNIVEGLVNGIKGGFSVVVSVVKAVINKIVELFNDLDWGALLTIGISVGFLSFAYKLSNALEALASPLEGFGDVCDGAKSALKALATDIRADALLKIAKAIAILVASIALLTFLDQGKLLGAMGVIVGLAATMGLLIAAVGKWGPKESFQLGKFSIALVSVATSLLIMAIALKQVSGIDDTSLSRGAKAIAMISVIFVALVSATKLFNKDANKVGTTLILMSVSMLLMVKVIKQVSELDPAAMENGILAIGLFGAVFIGLIAATKLFGHNASSIGMNLIKMVTAILMVVFVAKLVSGLDPNSMVKGGAAIAALGLLLAGLIGITRLAGGNLKGVGTTLLLMSAAMLLLVQVIKSASGLSAKELLKGVAVIAVLTLVIAGLIAATRLAGGNLKGVGTTLLLLAISVGILAGVTALLGLVKTENLVKGIIAVGLLSAMMSLMLWSMRGVGNIKGNLVVLTVAIGLLALSVAALSQIDGKKLASASLSLGLLMGMFSLMIKASGVATTSIKSILTMTVVVGLLGGLLYALSKLDIGSTLETAASLSMLILAISASLMMLNRPTFVTPATLANVALMGLIVGGLGLILYSLQGLPVDSTLANAASLSVLLLALSGACLILSGVGATGPAAFIGVGALATLIVGIGGLIVSIGALVDKFPKLETFLNKGIPILEKIGYGLGSFFGNIVGGFIDGAILDRLPILGESLSSFMSNANTFIEGAKNIDGSVITGIGSLAGAILALTAADFINGLASFMPNSGSFALLGADLSAFMYNASGFLSGASSIDPSIAESAKLLAQTILILTAADLISGITNFGSQGSNLTTFASQLKQFGEAMVAFSATVAGRVDEAAVTAAASAGKIMAELQSSLYGTGGVIQWLCGEKNLSLFGTQLVAFGNAIVSFSSTVAGRINEEAVVAAANAGKVMAEMQSKIVGTGGVVQWFCGEKNMAVFGSQLVAFGNAIVGFSKTVAMDGALNEEAINAAAKAGTLMTTLQTSIVPTGGVVKFFTGEKNLETFGSQLVAFGQAMVDFSAKVAGNVNSEAVVAAANAGLIMASVQKALPEDKWFDGKVTLEDFGKDLKKFGEGISGYSEKVTGIDTAAITASLNAAKKLISLTRSLVDLDTSGIEKFKIKSIGSAIAGYSDKVAKINSEAISSSISIANRLVRLITSLVSLDTSGVGSFQSAIDSLGGISLDNFTKAFSGVTGDMTKLGSNLIDSIVKGIKSKQASLSNTSESIINNVIKALRSKISQFNKTGVEMMNAVVKAFTSYKSKIKGAATSSISEAVSSIKGYYDNFYRAGKYLVEGFAAGITANTFKAEAKAAAMARAALEAAEEELDIESPSKAFYKVGDFAGQGFINALSDYVSTAYRAGSEMAGSAKTGLGEAVGKIRDTLDAGMDVNPTIRPVLDLSEIRSGAGNIHDLLSIGSSVSVLTNVGSVSALMNRNRQNGNVDVVSAIDKLRKELGNVGSTSYVVNGVTYDDGSTVSDAVKSLIRAARVERRI